MGRYADALRLTVDLHAEHGVDLYSDPEFRAAAAERLHPDFECSSAALQSPAYRGLDGLERMQREFAEAWDEISYEIEEVVETDRGVFAAVRYRGTGRGSGATIERTFYFAHVYRDDRLHRFFIRDDRREARRAVGA